LSAAQVYRDRDQFASLVREVAAPDVGRMGIEILSFTIKGTDDQPYVCPGYELMSRPMAQ
jgi:flotillin